MNLLLDTLSWIFLLGGGVFAVTGGLGLLRLPDFYCRIHAASLTDTLGTALIVVGLALQAGFTVPTTKLILIVVFMVFTNPTATHALAKAARRRGLQPVQLDCGGAGSSKNS